MNPALIASQAAAAALLVSRRAGRKQPIPFGPFMIAGAVLAVVAQPG